MFQPGGGRGTNVCETPQFFGLKDEHDDWGEDQACKTRCCAQLPCDLALAGARVDESHDGEGVEGGEEVEDFEEVVPCVCFLEEVGVTSYEDGCIKELG